MSITRYVLAGLMIGALGAPAAQADTKWRLNQSRAEAMQDCLAQARYWRPSQRSKVAGYMGVSQARAPRLFCQRLINALASGRITNKDVAKFRVSGSGKLLQIIKGR